MSDCQERLPVSTERNYGIDFFRIISMLLIITLHIFTQGAIRYDISQSNPNYFFAAFMFCIAYPCVEYFGAISGYVGVDSKHKYTNIVIIWIETMFYIWLGNLLYYIFIGPIEESKILPSFFPIIGRRYWFITAYFGLFIFMPFLNYGMKKLNFRKATLTIVILFVLFTLAPSFECFSDQYFLNKGYSTLWLMFCYLIGAYCKRFKEYFDKVPTYFYLFIYALSTFVLILNYYNIGTANENFFANVDFLQYTSVPVVICTFCMINVFSRVKLSKVMQKITKLFAPCVLGVFLLHCHAVIWDTIIRDSFDWIANVAPYLFLPALIGCVLLIFLAGSLVDLVRQLIFNKLKLKERIYRFEQRVLKD